jgi:lysozyme|tara:strand:+ start:101 stop:550 length:450 start_codon:yes stop_codon:yes gene_type:complete
MMDRNKLIEELIMDEGYKYETYHDHLGFLTLGVGHLVLDSDPEIKMDVGTPVSEERIKECLNNDLDIVCEELDRNMSWWRGLDGTRQRVLANMCFNLGYPRLSKFVKFIAAMQKGDWKKASEEMMDSKWATQVGNRAVRLQQMVIQGEK